MARQSAQWFEEVLNAMEDLVLVKGDKSRLLWANQAFLDCYGMTASELKDLVDSSHSDPDDTVQYVRDDAYVHQTGKTLDIPSEPITDAQGNIRHYHTVKSPIKDDSGKVIRSVGVSRLNTAGDHSTSKIARAEKKQTSTQLRSLAKHIPTPMMMLDMKGRIICFSEAWRQKLGHYVEDPKKPLFFEETYGQKVQIQGLIEKSLTHGKKQSVSMLRVIHDHTELLLQITINPWFLDAKEMGGVIISAEDQTVRYETEKSANQISDRLQLALDASGVGIWDWDVETNHLTWDDQMYQLYGTSKDAFSGAYDAWTNGLHPDDKAKSNQDVQNALSGEKKFDTEFRVVWPTGEVRTIRAIARVWRNLSGDPVRMLGVNWDTTKEKKQERLLMRRNEELQQFAYRTSHDIKAPLMTIRGLSELISEDLEENDLTDLPANLKKIERLSLELESLINDILSLTRSDHIEEELVVMDLEKEVQRIREKFEYILAQEKVEIETDIRLDRPLRSLPTRLTLILENLISNGIKYSNSKKPEKKVIVRCYDLDVRTVLEIQDNGIGIPESRQDKVFDMFSRFHAKKSFGSGLGLYLVKQQVEHLKGEIYFLSTNEGTLFRVTLPNEKEITEE